MIQKQNRKTKTKKLGAVLQKCSHQQFLVLISIRVLGTIFLESCSLNSLSETLCCVC